MSAADYHVGTDADIATRNGAGDKVLCVGADPPYLLHLEFQASHEATELPRKLQLRSTLLENRHRIQVVSAAFFGYVGRHPFRIFHGKQVKRSSQLGIQSVIIFLASGRSVHGALAPWHGAIPRRNEHPAGLDGTVWH
jgi:hypothetical protein